MYLRQRKGGRTLATETEILQDQIITGPLFNEPMRVVIVRPNGPDSVEAGLDMPGELSLHRGTKAEARCLAAGNLQSAPPEDLRKLRNL